MVRLGPGINFNAMLGRRGYGVGGRGYGVSGRVGVNGVVGQIKRLLDELPEVQQASGTINVKLEGQKPKTVTFKYK